MKEISKFKLNISLPEFPFLKDPKVLFDKDIFMKVNNYFFFKKNENTIINYKNKKIGIYLQKIIDIT